MIFGVQIENFSFSVTAHVSNGLGIQMSSPEFPPSNGAAMSDEWVSCSRPPPACSQLTCVDQLCGTRLTGLSDVRFCISTFQTWLSRGLCFCRFFPAPWQTAIRVVPIPPLLLRQPLAPAPSLRHFRPLQEHAFPPALTGQQVLLST